MGETNSQLVGKREAEVSVEAAEGDFGEQLGAGQGTVSNNLCGRNRGLGHTRALVLSIAPLIILKHTHTHTHILSWSLPSRVYLPPCFYGAHLEDGSIVLGRSRE